MFPFCSFLLDFFNRFLFPSHFSFLPRRLGIFSWMSSAGPSFSTSRILDLFRPIIIWSVHAWWHTLSLWHHWQKHWNMFNLLSHWIVKRGQNHTRWKLSSCCNALLTRSGYNWSSNSSSLSRCSVHCFSSASSLSSWCPRQKRCCQVDALDKQLDRIWCLFSHGLKEACKYICPKQNQENSLGFHIVCHPFPANFSTFLRCSSGMLGTNAQLLGQVLLATRHQAFSWFSQSPPHT